MKKMTKILSLTLALVLAVGLGVGGTLAWLNATAGEVNNTFYATGLIDPDPNPEGYESNFEIWEHVAKPNALGSYILEKTDSIKAADLIKANRYKVVPGTELQKDPFVYIDTDEAAYVYVEVLDGLKGIDGLTYSIDSANWVKMEDVTPKHEGAEVYKYVISGQDGVVKGEADAITINLLDGKKITVGNDFDVNALSAEKNLQFFGYAAQQATFATAEDAWNATFGATKK